MTNPFEQALIAANDAFFSTFGQSVTIYPDGETPRTVDADVKYEDIEPVPGMSHGKGQAITIAVRNNAETGLSTAEFDSGLAKVEIPERIGKTATIKRLSKIIKQDAAMVTYQVR